MSGEFDKGRPTGSTYYQAFVGAGALFEGKQGVRLADVTDGVSFTVMVVEAASPVPWTKPEDLPFAKDKPLPKLGGQFAQGFHLVFADAGAAFVSKDVDDATLRSLITRNGGEVIPAEKIPMIHDQ
jgi:hypothetical protein